MSWTTARAKLDAKLVTLSSLGSSAIAWPNVPLAAQTALFYKVDFIPATVQPELAGSVHETGIYQVTVFAPAAPAGQGIGSALTQAQAVSDLFKRQNLTGTSCGVPTLGPLLQDANWVQVPVSIPFVVL